MINPNAAYAAVSATLSKEPRYVFKVEFSDDPADTAWIRSHGDITISEPGVVLDARLKSVSAVSQKLNTRQGTSEIGRLSFSALDVNASLTDHQRAQLTQLDHGARWRTVQYYHGYRQLDFADYEVLATQILNQVSYKNREYRFKCADVQRVVRQKIFEPVVVNLAQTLDRDAATIELVTTNGLQMVQHDSGFGDAPGQLVGYVQIDDEIIRYTGITAIQLTGCTRAVLNTRPAEHVVNDTGKDVTEIIYLEGPFTRIAYAVLTGVLLNQVETLPAHWHAGVQAAFVRLADFLSIGGDWFDTTDSTLGLPVRFVNPGEQDAKRWVEQELCRVFSCFMPVYADGQLGWRRNQPVLSGATPIFTIDDSMITGDINVVYDQAEVVNDFTVAWSELNGRLIRKTRLIDQASIDTHKRSSEIVFNAAGIHGSSYSAEQLAAILERFRDRYSAPPIKVSITLRSPFTAFEVGDVVRLKTTHAILYTESEPIETGLLHSFEVQQIRFNPTTGQVKLDLFGTSADAGPLPVGFTQLAIPDAWFSATGTDVLTLPGVVDQGPNIEFTQSITLTGAVSNRNAILYATKDLLIPQGVTVSYSDNVMLRGLGTLTINGVLNGAGLGLPGTSDVVDLSSVQQGLTLNNNPPATTPGTPGFLGTTQAGGAMIERADQDTSSKYYYNQQSVLATITQGDYPSMPGFFVEWDGSDVTGIPTDLRGSSGGAGGYRYWRDSDNPSSEINRGGDGGAGGAGLVLVFRGVAFGASGTLDSSGADGVVGVRNPADEQPAWSSTGAGGAPGGTLAIIDGPLNPIPIAFGAVTATYGLSDDPVTTFGPNRVPEAWQEFASTRFGPPEIKNAKARNNRISYFTSPSAGVEMGASAFRSVLILPDIAPVADETDEQAADRNVITLAITEAFDERDDSRVTLLRATVTLIDVLATYGSAAIYHRLSGTGQWTLAGYAENVLEFDLPADGNTYEFEARPVLVNGVESATGFAQSVAVTDSNVAPAAPAADAPQPLVNGGRIKLTVPNTGGKPKTISIYRSTTIDDASPGQVDSVPLFYVAATDEFCADYLTAQLTGGTNYYYWFTSVNESGNGGPAPAFGTDGVLLTPTVSGSGPAGAPGISSVASGVMQFTWIRATDGTFSSGTTADVDESFSQGNTPNISTFTVRGTRDAQGAVISIAFLGSPVGEAVTLGTPQGLTTRSAYVDVTHNTTGQKKRIYFVTQLDGTNAQRTMHWVPNRSRSDTVSIGELAVVGFGVDGLPEFPGAPHFFWNGARIDFPHYDTVNSVLTGLANRRGFVCVNTALPGNSFLIGVSQNRDAAFVFKQSDGSWVYDNNSGSALPFTPTDDYVTLGWLETGAADTIVRSGMFAEPVSLESAALPGADVTGSNTAAGIAGQGDLATQDDVDFGSQVTGATRPENNATRNIGALADLDSIDTSEIDPNAVTEIYEVVDPGHNTGTDGNRLLSITIPASVDGYTATIWASANGWEDTRLTPTGPPAWQLELNNGFGVVTTVTMANDGDELLQPGRQYNLQISYDITSGAAETFNLDFNIATLGDTADFENLRMVIVVTKR